MPEWKFERGKSCKTSAGPRQSFLLERPGLNKSKLSDDRLGQFISQSGIRHNSVLIQVYEFQATVRRWLVEAHTSTNGSHSVSGVTSGGFCECLQGSTAMARGIVVLTGTGEMNTNEVRRCLPSVLRRIHCVGELGWTARDDIRSYFRSFLKHFVPNGSADEWCEWENTFTQKEGPWAGDKPISLDMLKQFLIRQITESSCVGSGDFVRTAPRRASMLGVAPPATATSPRQADFLVSAEQRPRFLSFIFEKKQAENFLDTYAPVCPESSARVDGASD